MEERKELKNKMEQFLSDVEQMRDSIGGKNAEIEMFEDEIANLKQEKLQLETYSHDWPELAEEKQEEIEKTEEMLKELYEEKEKEDELKKSELESLEEPAAEITEILAEIEMFEEELAQLESDKKTLEVYSYNEPELAEEKQEEIEKTEKQIEELYEQLGKYKDMKVNFKGDFSKNIKTEPKKVEPTKVPPVKTEPKKVEPTKVPPVKTEPKKVEPTKVPPVKTEPKKVEPTKVPPTIPEQKEETALREPSKWDKFKNKCKELWNKFKGKFGKTALAAAIGISAVGPADIAHTEKVTHQGEKIEERETTKTEEVDINEILDNLKVGDIITLKGDSELLYTSNLGMPSAIIEQLTKSGADLKVMTTKIVGDKIHFSLVVDGSEPIDLTVGGASELLEKGELDNLPDNLKSILGTDIGWTSKDQLKDMIKPMEKQVKTTEQVKVPYEYETEKTTYTHFVKPDAKKVETPPQPVKEELKTQEPYKPNGYEDVEKLENDQDVEIGNGIKVSLANEERETRKSRIAKAREDSKEEETDKLLDEYVKGNKFRDSIKVDNKDNRIEKSATKTIELEILDEKGNVVDKTEGKESCER